MTAPAAPRTVDAVYRFLLTPRWWGINLFAVLAIPVCLLMGSWQLSRFEARVESHREQERTTSAAAGGTSVGALPAKPGGEGSGGAKARPLARLLPVDAETSGRTARATGRYDTDRQRQLLVPDRQLGEKQGFYVLSLLRTDATGGASQTSQDSQTSQVSQGKALPVVRGWLPGDADSARVPAPPRGKVTVTGALQASESQDSTGVRADGGLPEGQLAMISAASLVNVVSYDVYDAWITVQHTEGGSGLRPVPPVRPDNTGLDMKAFQNLGYTAEWFVFAGFVVFMWFRLFRRDAELARDAALGLIPDPDSAPSQGADGAAGEQSRSPASTA